MRVPKNRDETAADLDLDEHDDEPAPDADGVHIGDVEQTEERRRAVNDSGD
jgi:hypothetical protein